MQPLEINRLPEEQVNWQEEVNLLEELSWELDKDLTPLSEPKQLQVRLLTHLSELDKPKDPCKTNMIPICSLVDPLIPLWELN